jgi:transcriptional regulator with XRE-family HTH domain
MASKPDAKRIFVDRLNYLYATVTKPDGSEYSNDEVAKGASELGEPISSSYLWQIRKGKKLNPSMWHAESLARFFGVSVDYFSKDDVADRVQAQLAELKREQERLAEIASRDPVKLMALRAGELTPDRFRMVSDLVDVVYRDQLAEEASGGK